MEANFVELIARNTTLEEVQAYVLLRQSTLSADDKKRILLEHGGELKYGPVVKAFRLLGSRFFNEFQTGRSSQKNKVYDVNVSEADQHEHHATVETGHHERAFFTHADEHEVELEPDFIEALIAQDDADALTVSTFEGEFEEFLQETPEMYEALTSYIEARSKLVEKRKSRGFWPVKGKGKSFKGRGKGFGKRSKDREALLQRISKSHCRRCGALGHWKAECPQASQTEKSAMPSSSATAHVVIDERPQEIFQASTDTDEVISEDEYELPSVEARNVRTMRSPTMPQFSRSADRLPGLAQPIRPLFVIMPPMVSALKTIAEALIRLLTMLLQILVQQLEKQEILAEMEIENEPEAHAHLQDMMRQIQQQGAALEALREEVEVRKKTPERKVRPQPAVAPMSVASMTSGSSTPLSRPQIPNVSQRKSRAPSVVSQAASWQEIEAEEETILVQEMALSVPVELNQSRTSVPPAPTLPLPRNLTISEWGANLITFGRKHKGKTFSEVMEKDPGYLQWSLARYGSLMPEHQDFCRFGQLWLTHNPNEI
ncbi:unnamed protein product [Cladocopium goreaui]|uniref:CCHC-type domain-containing protein n=1 Tax=Cladocopium goreaui TaxID=2562237 RepID=A0A9P1BNR9_9DINO|nr:unnamed protein product [Cladocopium goreaui]